MEHPYLDVGLQRWIKNYARQNHWRVAKWIDVEDLEQEGYFVFTKVLRKYPGLAKIRNPTPDNRRVFVKLVQRSFDRHITDLANYHTSHSYETAISSILRGDQEYETWMEENAPTEDPTADLVSTLRRLPRELRRLADLLQRDVENGVQYITVKVNGRQRKETAAEHVIRRAGFDLRQRRPDESFNEFLCRKLHLDPTRIDILRALSQHYGVRVINRG